MDELKVTSMEELKNQSTEVIELQPFAGDKLIRVRVKRLSILGLCQSGEIPNQLLGVARKLFYQEDIQKIDLKEYGKIIDIICENTLVEPSIEQLKEAGLKLTDVQKFELWAYSQQGVEGLKSFRKITKGAISNSDVKGLQNKAKSNFKHKK
ncbi:hypothetical protein GTH52_07060 [Clostridium tyrobutyricum]|uniref:Conserved protein n=1 Tax=Clostridium tyrobutyricum DIVETGP TaxID=1408889 RepID=W6NHB1_CLOTY|nr:hypothetical protein [Clostridium tyrobutyricum]AND84273.1 hypothetical protein CTK_C10120 [Clostridium tyrobutyricum]AND84357.1 hypothetical protein CTK_C10960 [Clostridium tyrobutyricum]ANP68988.1 hypothetical protein BA182_04660 [Clostridium tyrobutyricum]MBV4435407.1 hypothetical protein [Clostridium tyrobutyricum]QNB66663.1 hypothetical protein GTH52_07060 [Clostridium tyrobutyricum]